MHEALDDFYYNTKRLTEIATGGAEGVDSYADKWAEMMGIDRVIFPANWTKYDRGAGPARNARMFESFVPDLVIAFPGGRGTQHMVDYALVRDCQVHWIFQQ